MLTGGRAIPARAGLGLLGAASGAVIGALIGGTIVPHHDCNCDDPGLDEVIISGAIGTILGAGLAAGAPRFESTCSAKARLALGLLGGAAGAGGAGGVPAIRA